mmetsp:Transcript_25580/g.55943  ORF Transcript_25580/g.55943 Transcript_25580/m.55943 type:complete len:717 (-) Transcript_25580:408-2558(-)|eukprot:CAMPEP_0178488726 /NCGR_PEP_ID=MMETSP0696-20121128/10009_1 /TAXON_ID=265572 /ORGANISM="Extubocellulus spinifer, Strain CCMP396" /LENGTH=716 /DNA_ID=CAMNT_0020116505 /DNA_START=99 /DNA_END=2252 /DNA_ORIENTATION=+
MSSSSLLRARPAVSTVAAAAVAEIRCRGAAAAAIRSTTSASSSSGDGVRALSSCSSPVTSDSRRSYASSTSSALHIQQPLVLPSSCISLAAGRHDESSVSTFDSAGQRTLLSTAAAEPDGNDGSNGDGDGGSGGGGRSEDEGPKQASASVVKQQRLSKVPISEVLNAKHTLRWVEPVIDQHATIQEGMAVAIERGLSGMMVVDRESTTSTSSRERGKVVGMTTSRDLLRVMHAGFKEGKTADELVKVTVKEFMTPLSQVIYARPEETIGTCRIIMAKLGVKCLPILSHGRVEGLITARDISEYSLEAREGVSAKGGKKNYLKHVSERVGLSVNTSMAEPPAYLKAQLALEQNPLFINVGVAEMPHPFKTPESCGMNARDHGPNDHSTDTDLSEDAYFVCEVNLPDDAAEGEVGTYKHLTYMGVADGVGSWREYGVDPREFSHRLMDECEHILKEASENAREDADRHRIIAPAEVLAQAYERVKAANIIGSSTACVALFDNARHQLHFSNLGDSGIIVLRHIDSDVAGSLKRDRTTPRADRKSDLRVAFVSQQQLRSFNHPYQFGWTGEELKDDESSFKTAADSCTTSIHIRRGDIIIMATDGLFDNVDIDDIAKVALEWEQKNGFIRGGDIAAREKRWSMGNSMSVQSCETLPELAQTLCEKARENSLDSSVDSPFAILAKENDIMWSGGMPDDCTVVAMHVVGRRSDDVLDRSNN